jgi:hypothetical protein
MSTGWLNRINRKLMYKILVGASTLYWAIWLSWNDMVFNNTRVVTPMNVIFRWTHWICFRVLLRKEDERPHIIRGWRVLETSMMEIFASNGWSFSNKITFTWRLTLFQRPLYLLFWNIRVCNKNICVHSFMQRLKYIPLKKVEGGNWCGCLTLKSDGNCRTQQARTCR